MSDVESGKADGWVGSYADEAEFAVYAEYAFDADDVIAIFKKGRFDKSPGQQILLNRHVGWVI